MIRTVIKFTSDQLLISSNLKCHFSATKQLDIIISESHFTKQFFTSEEVDLHDVVFTLVDDGFDSCDLFGLVKVMTFSEVFSFTRLA